MRLVNVARRRLLGLTGGRRYRSFSDVSPRLRENPDLTALTAQKLAGRTANGASARAAEIIDGQFEFLGQQHALPDPIDWRLKCRPEASHLWRFVLHYNEFLLDLAAEGRQRGTTAWYDRAWDLVRQWIEGNSLRDARVLNDAWHPYCISRRLPAWILLWTASPPDGELREQVLRSVVAQAMYLQKHLEWDVRGNHLLENAKALVLAGAFLEGPDADRWLRRGSEILRKELREQILPHGEHFERSSMYHALMLDVVLDVRDATKTVVPDLSEFCAETADKMAAFLEQTVHPDGEIPLLGDARFGETPPAEHLITRATRQTAETTRVASGTAQPSGSEPSTRTPGDYWIYRHDGDFLLFDAGPVGPDHLPAHAHADLLTFEATVRGRRLFVDSGVFNYQDDAMRRYCRSSAAHNVLTIDDRDQCDVWSRFRMGYRGWPRGFASGETHGFHWARACHNAYRRLGVPTVGRWVACRPDGPWFFVDWAEGKGTHKLTSRLHLHPDFDAEVSAADEVLIRGPGGAYRLRALTPGSVAVTKGWYCPGFGRRIATSVVECSATVTLPAVCGWFFAPEDVDGEAALSRDDGQEPVLSWRDDVNRLQLQPFA